MPAGSPERAERTRKFQLVNDAYYTLSDPKRREEYDTQRRLFSQPSGGDPFAQGDYEDENFNTANAGGSADFYSWAWDYFTKNGSGHGTRQQTEEAQFGDVFEEMMRDEGMAEGEHAGPTKKFWSIIGGLSGGALGFIVANFAGLLAGAVAGNRLGAIRDARGKSVYAVFQELPIDARTRLLSQLATRVFSHAAGI